MPNIEDHIQKAIQDGQFDDLVGKGKPLRLEENPYADPDWRMANHILKSSGFTLPWIEKRQEILQNISNIRSLLSIAWRWREQALTDNQPLPVIDAEWQRALLAYGEQIEALNQKIKIYNLEVPSDHFQIGLLNLEREVAELSSLSG